MENFEKLAWNYLDGTMSTDEQSGFQERVAADPQLADQLAAYAVLHEQIRASMRKLDAELQGQSLGGLAHPHSMSTVHAMPSQAGQDAEAREHSAYSGRSNPRLSTTLVACLLSTAATVLLLLSAGYLQLDEPSTIAQQAEPIQAETMDSSSPEDPEREWKASISAGSVPIVATLTGAVDCVWEPGYEATYGELISQGREIRLREGLAQLTFDSGAKLIVQGPATFVARTETSATMDQGKISALCPERARGFKLRTPTSEIIDIGTEFAVDVQESGDSEIHVFQGEVISRHIARDGKAGGETHSILANNAVRFTSSDSEAVSLVSFNEGKFVREIQPRLSTDELPPLTVGRDLALWLAADVHVKRDDENNVIAWRDVLFGDNQSAEDAASIYSETRPVFVPDAINGKPAIHFDGQAYLVTTPLETTADQSLFVVYVDKSIGEERNNPYQLISYNGPPTVAPVNGAQPGVLQIGHIGPLIESGIAPRFGMAAYVYYVKDGLGHHAGIAETGELKRNTPQLLSYVFDYQSYESRLSINGVLHCKGQIKHDSIISAKSSSRKVIGAHGRIQQFLRGDIAEVLIYNTALNTDEKKSVEMYLMEKYEINGEAAN